MPRFLLGTLLASAAFLGAFATAGSALGATPVGSEFQVNTYTTSNQYYSSVAVEADGDFVVVWHSFGSADADNQMGSIQGQRYDSSGNSVGSEFQVNTYATGNQSYPEVAVDADGDFVVVWQSSGSAGSDSDLHSIQAQRYDASGGTVGSEFQVNSYTTRNQRQPSVGVDADGNFVVVWQSHGGGGSDTSRRSIQGQRYDLNGNALGIEFQVNTYTSFDQRYPSVAVDADGDFVVVWNSDGGGGSDTSYYSVQGQRYDSSGSAVGGQFQVNTYTSYDQKHPSVSVDADGDFVVVWNSDGSAGSDTSLYSIQGQRYDGSGSPVGPEFQVNTYTTSYQSYPQVAVDTDGGFVVVWNSYGSSGSDTEFGSVQGQRFSSGGFPFGTEFQVNTYTTQRQKHPAVAVDPDGAFVAVWGSNGSSGSDTSFYSVQGQRYLPEPDAVLTLGVGAAFLALAGRRRIVA